MKKRNVLICKNIRWSDEQALCYTVWVARKLTLGKSNRYNVAGRILIEDDRDILIAKYKKKKDVVLY